MRVPRVAIAVGVSTAMVVAIAALIPRGYFANDDIGFTEVLRKNVFTPWISPILVRAFGFAYQEAPGVPWFGLYQYAVIIATGAVLIHTCLELIDPRSGAGQTATLLGALVLGASHAILVIGLTWTTVSISALGTAVAAFIAHVQLCQAARRPVSRLRALGYGLLLISGYMLRPQGLGAVAVALAPLLVWALARCVRTRYLPRFDRVIVFAAPFVVVLALQDRIPQLRGAERTEFNDFNNARGLIHGQTAYEQLDSRAPELLARAGWTVQDYRDFISWLIIDENDFPAAKVQRLLDTGGAPEAITPGWSYDQLRAIFDSSPASAWLFATAVLAGVLLAWIGLIARWRGVAFSLGYLGLLLAVPLWMVAHYRFPQRVALSFYTVAALGIFVYLAREIADRPAQLPMPARPARRAAIALVVVSACLFNWARQLIVWLDRVPWAHAAELQAFEDRVAARKGFVFVYVQTGLAGLDPLRAEPRSYDGLQGGWGTFSLPWYENIARLGIARGTDLLPAMLDNPDAYLLTPRWTRRALEDWIRRKLHAPAVRLAFVEGADILGPDRPELYRLVTAPLIRDGEEWRALERDEWAMNDLLPGPPSVAGLAFHPVAFAAPYASYVSPLAHPAAGIVVTPIDDGVRCIVAGSSDASCPANVEDTDRAGDALGDHAGVHVAVEGVGAVRFSVRLLDPENIIGLSVYGQTSTSRAIRWRWQLSPEAQHFGFIGTFTLVPGHSAHRLALVVNSAGRRDIRDLHIFIEVKPGSHAGFELRHLEVAPP